ncbi:hypothetical protein C5B42_03715 [Candidatus Cerribacteria bacterium 'Amazon FNV 2010 28 9']|uniref:Uncharacterized protein n=1 Tax=Candidatus Cerribacteria bacterium 'Amazon FNV 2010 28 9' TaxID=2081795 RepID=A0A317JNC1_9BACT|nr:MAG: hypothetical protein C5B42_03715 [Candidatus Cerribacteria bacterium 'Amazon FNV 2010 28 9']
MGEKPARKLIGKGMDSQVFQREGSNYLVKRSYGINYLISLLNPNAKARRLNNELEETKTVASQIGIEVPKTRVIQIKPNTPPLVVQRYIRSDKSVDTEAFVQQHKDNPILKKVDINPGNFLSQGGKVYIIDTFHGMVSRLLFRLGLDSGGYRKMIEMYKKFQKNLLRKRE